jgi:structural maintenance of chromosome 2
LTLELESLLADVAAAVEGVEAAELALNQAVEMEEIVQMKLGATRATYEEARAKLTIMESKWAECLADLAGLKEERSAMSKEMEARKLEAKKVSIKLTKLQKDRSEAEKKVVALEKNFSWVASEKSAFGVRGGDYDFEASNLPAVHKELIAMRKEQDTLVSRRGQCS